ncbi:arylamine N-acetyltransferase family protein [Kitasatospora sp. McL0602]|uniref:arylamine N-acetyltransferase family protein n=1 Tax=Kitasatospora sp. McL0602 TaxID=3439530 RepID=UPI003F88C898
MDDTRMESYLARIGAQRPDRPDLAGLRRLQQAHLSAVPFESLSIHLGEPVQLDAQSLLAKIVDRRRGGFCYELNGAFALLLTALGYRVELLGARVFNGPQPGPPFDHLALRVLLDEPWLVDVGFGRFSRQPLRLDSREPQTDPGGVFTLTTTDGPDLDVLMDGEPQYRLDQRPYAIEDFTPTCWWQTTSPDSAFTRSPTCSLPTVTGRITLSGTRLITTAADGTRAERELTGPEALDAYRTHFGIALDRLPVANASLTGSG